ncbi:hypothetical protein ZIOFF_021403 [Zingiber officinale]|uniref:Pentatricopeptide repeat-containing protein n=1 Tax=Zingiber officinale TaxID=94328 RepID=A0A8J5H9P4_ZINOF|nr:hypothetical protein ZIOFF_021403 [Zingiber officinale]
MAMRDLISWNALIVGIVCNKLHYDEMEPFRSLLNNDGLLTPNQVSLSNMLSTCSNVCSIGFGRVVHDLAVKLTVESSLAYVFDRYAQTEVVTWNVMMMGWIESDCPENACGCFLHMVGEGVFPDETSFCTLLQALAMLASWGQGAAVHYLIVKTRCTQNQCVGSSLITMYAKCCCLELEDCNHNELIDQGFKYYTCMVDLLGRAGHLDEAIIDAMPIHPDSSVWGALLAACRKFKNLELRLRKEIRCSWIYVSNKTFVFTAHRQSHQAIEQIYEMVGRLKELVKTKGSATAVSSTVVDCKATEDHYKCDFPPEISVLLWPTIYSLQMSDDDCIMAVGDQRQGRRSATESPPALALLLGNALHQNYDRVAISIRAGLEPQGYAGDGILARP